RSFGCEGRWCGSRGDHGHLLAHQISRQLRQPIIFTLRPAVFNCHVLTFDITSFFQTANETGHERCERTRRCAVEEPGHRHRRLRPRCKRPRSSAAEKRHELAALHSITSSARCCRNQGTSTPRALAVLRLITSSNFVGSSTGKSEGFVPCKILCMRTALRRKISGTSAPYDIRPPACANCRSTEALGKRYLAARSATVLEKKMPCTTTASARSCAIVAKAASTSSGALTIATGAISMLVIRPAR